MPILHHWQITVSPEQVLCAMGAQNPATRPHRPGLSQTVRWAIRQGSPVLAPVVLYEQFDVEARSELLSIPAVAQHLAPARQVIVALCTIGRALESQAEQHMPAALLKSMALDALGTAAVESLAAQACAHFHTQAAQVGRHTSPPLSPGAAGWSVAEGQPQVFQVLDAASIGVILTPSAMMVPCKSISMIIGIAPGTSISAFTGSPLADASAAGDHPCQDCDFRPRCKYQVPHAQ